MGQPDETREHQIAVLRQEMDLLRAEGPITHPTAQVNWVGVGSLTTTEVPNSQPGSSTSESGTDTTESTNSVAPQPPQRRQSEPTAPPIDQGEMQYHTEGQLYEKEGDTIPFGQISFGSTTTSPSSENQSQYSNEGYKESHYPVSSSSKDSDTQIVNHDFRENANGDYYDYCDWLEEQDKVEGEIEANDPKPADVILDPIRKELSKNNIIERMDDFGRIGKGKDTDFTDETLLNVIEDFGRLSKLLESSFMVSKSYDSEVPPGLTGVSTGTTSESERVKLETLRVYVISVALGEHPMHFRPLVRDLMMLILSYFTECMDPYRTKHPKIMLEFNTGTVVPTYFSGFSARISMWLTSEIMTENEEISKGHHFDISSVSAGTVGTNNRRCLTLLDADHYKGLLYAVCELRAVDQALDHELRLDRLSLQISWSSPPLCPVSKEVVEKDTTSEGNAPIQVTPQSNKKAKKEAKRLNYISLANKVNLERPLFQQNVTPRDVAQRSRSPVYHAVCYLKRGTSPRSGGAVRKVPNEPIQTQTQTQ